MQKVCRLLTLLVCVCSASFAQTPSDHGHPPEDRTLHAEFYSKWKDVNNTSCCSDKDCYPTEARFNVEEHIWYAQLRETKEFVAIPRRIYDPDKPPWIKNPDGRAHICAPPRNPWSDVVIYCFVAPEPKA